MTHNPIANGEPQKKNFGSPFFYDRCMPNIKFLVASQLFIKLTMHSKTLPHGKIFIHHQRRCSKTQTLT